MQTKHGPVCLHPCLSVGLNLQEKVRQVHMEGNLPEGARGQQTKNSSRIQESGNFQVKLSEEPGGTSHERASLGK